MSKIISKSEQNLLRVQVNSNCMWWFQEFAQYMIDNSVIKNIVYPEVVLN